MPKSVFISYRRDDTGAAAGRVYDRLCHILPKANVFFDINTIGRGEDFAKAIDAEIARCDAALIFIGEKWLEPQQTGGQARIWDPSDYVRAEMRAILTRPILIVPVLVGRAVMPNPGQLPDDIDTIATKNAALLRHESFDDDTENIVATILGNAARGHRWETNRPILSKIVHAVVGATLAWTVLIVVAILHHWLLGRPLSASIGAPLTTLTIIAVSLTGAWLGMTYQTRKRGAG